MANGGGGRPIKVLNVAEKPSVAKSVAGILSRQQGLRMREGRSRFNKIFEFNYTINGRPCLMSFTSVTGHLMEIEFDERFKKWHSCDPVQLYHAPIRKYVPEVTAVIHSTCPFCRDDFRNRASTWEYSCSNAFPFLVLLCVISFCCLEHLLVNFRLILSIIIFKGLLYHFLS